VTNSFGIAEHGKRKNMRRVPFGATMPGKLLVPAENGGEGEEPLLASTEITYRSAGLTTP